MVFFPCIGTMGKPISHCAEYKAEDVGWVCMYTVACCTGRVTQGKHRVDVLSSKHTNVNIITIRIIIPDNT